MALVFLYRDINQIRQDIKRFIIAVKTRDHNLNFLSKTAQASFPELYKSFHEIIHTHKAIQHEQDAINQLIKNMLEQIPVGLMVLKKTNDKTEISFFNQAASNLLHVPFYQYWHRLEKHLPQFAAAINKISAGGKEFLELKIDEQNVQLSLELTPIKLQDIEYSIISFQNIKDEIELKETEAWSRLIDVISHEILNSITPISSLSSTVNTMIQQKEAVQEEDLDDLKLAIQTIQRRSEGLLDFVNDYRLIAELPRPTLTSYRVSEILQHVQVLMQPMVEAKNIRFIFKPSSSKISLDVDFKLIEQALINLITNSIYALDETTDPYIEISYRLLHNKVYIDVCDNGKGIDKSDLNKIFIPFFTTRKNGSGIGLTISRNIMKMHQGNLIVQAMPGQATCFSLVFNY